MQKTIFNLLKWREGEGGWKWELFNKSSKNSHSDGEENNVFSRRIKTVGLYASLYNAQNMHAWVYDKLQAIISEEIRNQYQFYSKD